MVVIKQAVSAHFGDGYLAKKKLKYEDFGTIPSFTNMHGDRLMNCLQNIA